MKLQLSIIVALLVLVYGLLVLILGLSGVLITAFAILMPLSILGMVISSCYTEGTGTRDI